MAADSPVSVEVDMTKISKEIDKFGAELGRKSATELGQLGDKIVNAMRGELRQSPPGQRSSPRTRGHNSRDQAARGIDATVDATGRPSLTIRSSSSKMARGRQAFPAAYNLQRWSHPVFGNRRTRVTQRGRPFFTDVARSFEKRARESFEAAGQAAFDTIKGDR